MARLARLYAPGVAQHIAQRGHDGRPMFLDADDHLAFLAILQEAARAHGLAVHAYVLLPGQLRLLGTPSDETTTARVLQAVGRRYVRHFNRKSGRSGPLWEGRYRSTLVDADAYLLACCRFLETLPVIDGLAATPGEYRWSSYTHHAGVASNPLVTDHACYWVLGNTPFERQAVYRALFATDLDAGTAQAIQESAEYGWALGGADFLATIAATANRRGHPLPRGRPAKARQ